VQAQAGGGVVVDLATRRVQSAAPPQAPPALPPLRFDDVGGLDEVKAQVRRKIIAPLEKPGLFEKFRRKSGGGVLMYGPPGCGKTLLARATAGEAGATFTAVQITDILDMYIGESERRLAEAFAEARERRPSVLFFDELEALAARRHYGAQDHKASMVSTFLNEFDGANASNEGVLVLAATNVPWAIDSAFRRPGRFDRVLFVPPPDRPARLAILKGLLRDRPVAPGLKLESLAEGTTGYSGADLRNLVETAVDLAIEESSAGDLIQPVSRRHLDAARAEVRPTTAEWLSTARNYVRYGNEGGIYDDVARFLDQHAQ
jgi:SpoVK/Ycf46/Vps4 family AAA+-type ATPase